MCVCVHVIFPHGIMIRKKTLSSNKEKHIHTRVKLPVEISFVQQCDDIDGNDNNDDYENDACDDAGRGKDVDGDPAQNYTEFLIFRCKMISSRETYAIIIRLINGHDVGF